MENNRILTRKEVSKLTGLHETTIYKLAGENRIPHSRSAGGNRMIFSERAIRLWMDSDTYKLMPRRKQTRAK
jgi:excisionase family DNA binding protein